ncbi:MAG: ABC transporter permease [Actinobacteria bacterium]|nr:ABC transporter permease [Actinomycetota bacterium]
MTTTAEAPTGSPSRTLPKAARRSPRNPRHLALWAVTALVALFLLAPLIVVVLFSFNGIKSVSHLEGWSLHWYAELWSNETVLRSLRQSLEISAVATVIGAVIGTMLAFGLVRTRLRATRAVERLAALSILTPETATAIALFYFFTVGIGLELSLLTVMIGHITFSGVFVMIVVRTRLLGVSEEVEEAALDLGAGPLTTIRLALLPQLLPAIAGASLFVFILSFDDFVTSYFTSGVGVTPLPVLIYGMVRLGVSPEINALGTSLMCVSALLSVLAMWLIGWKRGQRT